MAYKALYRTYRPGSFDEVAGQKHVVKTLQHAIDQHKIAHAYLFCGPRGTGKTSVAKIFAKTINCTADGHRPCLICENCMELQNGSHPDVIEIDAASNNGVEEVRNLIEKVKYAPLRGKYKVYIIDEAHMMTQGAFNALLKTIEEPPEHVIFILATTEPHKILPTIISRCQRFDFTKISDKEIEERIHEVLDAEQIVCEEEVIRTIAQLADGGLRDALSILDQCIAYAQNNIQLHHINEIYGITTIREKLELLSYIIDGNAYALMNKVEMLIEKGIDIRRLTIDLIEILKETIMFEYTKDAELLSILKSEECSSMIGKITTKKRFSMIHCLMETYDKYKGAANAASYLEVCMLQLLSEAQEASEMAAVKPVEKTEKHAVDVSRETLTKEKPSLELPEEEEDYVTEIEDHEETVHTISDGKESSMTISSSPKENKIMEPLKDEYVLSLLAGANKPEKAKDMEAFINLNDYMTDMTYAKYASLLRFCTIMASSETYLVVCVESQPEANEINEADSKNEFTCFIDKLTGKSKKVFAVSKSQQRAVIQQFKERMANKTLPAPAVVEVVKKEIKEEKEKTQEETILELFGKDNIIVTEE